MGLKHTGIGSLAMRLENVSELAPRESQRELERGANEIKRLAQQYAPVDEGDLESAIYGPEDENGDFRDRDYGGVNRRKRFYVGIDMEAPADGGQKRVGDYAVEMHEGAYNPGPKSAAKAGQLGVEVGPKFLDRAARDLEPEVSDKIDAAVARVISGGRR